MDLVDLPEAQGSFRLLDAVTLLQDAGRAGLVVRNGAVRYVVLGPEIVAALRERGNLALGELVPASRTASAVAVRPTDAMARQLDEEGAQYAVEAPPAEPAAGAAARMAALLVMVLTRHEYFAYGLRRPLSICRCRADATHVWLRDELVNRGRCNLDNAAVDCA